MASEEDHPAVEAAGDYASYDAYANGPILDDYDEDLEERFIGGSYPPEDYYDDEEYYADDQEDLNDYNRGSLDPGDEEGLGPSSPVGWPQPQGPPSDAYGQLGSQNTQEPAMIRRTQKAGSAARKV